MWSVAGQTTLKQNGIGGGEPCAVTIRDIMILLGFDIDEQSQNEAENSVKSLKDMATKALGAIGVAFSVAGAASFVKDCVSVASEVEEMQNKFDVVFQGMTDEVEAWAQSYSDAIGRNKNDIKTYLADQQNLLVGFGMTRQEGAELSKQMTTLALDLASFANLDETAAVNNMTKAVMGESEAAKALGAVLNDDTRARAMQAMGLSGTYEKLDQLTKMQVNYNAILAQSPDAIGDCERSLGSYRSTVVQFQSKLKEVKTLVGQFFMPTFQKVISFGSKGVTVLRDGVQKLNDFAAKIGGAEKIIGVLGVTIGATLAIVNFQKISDGLKLIGKGLSSVNLKVFAIAAVVLMLALIVQDFIAFMNGDNSVIGALFEKTGIDADKARATIQKAWSTIKAVKGVADKIKSFLGFSEPEDGPLSDFHTYMPDMIDLMTQGIASGKERVRSAVEEIAAGMSDGMNLEDNSGSVTGMVGNLLGGIKAAKTKANEMLGSMKGDGMTFNPKIAPVSDLGNFVQGIAAGKEKLKSFLQGFSGDLSFMTQANVVQPETVSKVGGGNDSKSVSITQNVNIDNQFNGDRAGQEKSSEAMDKAADDSTSEMARALQFARG